MAGKQGVLSGDADGALATGTSERPAQGGPTEAVPQTQNAQQPPWEAG